MIKSMTGFGRAKCEYEGREYNVEIKSVNHKYSDVSIKIPRQISYLEEKVRKEILTKVSRGKIDVFITLQDYSEKGKNIKMKLIYSKNDITLIHEDDGVGFDFNKPSNITEKNTGFGISSLKERVFLLGGKISFSSNNDGVGTVIKVIIPTLK